jgi:MFS family permease
MIYQLGMVAFSFYAVYAVGSVGVGVGVVGVLTGLMVFFQMLANPIMGALGDRTNHFFVLFLGTLAAMVSTLLASFLNSAEGLYLVFALAGIASVAGFTTTMVLSLGFGTPAEQSTYIGMSNTFIAPFTLAAPFLAGWMITAHGYQAMFRACAAVFFFAALLSLRLLLKRKPGDSLPQIDPTRLPL